jgi:hypothetical protein
MLGRKSVHWSLTTSKLLNDVLALDLSANGRCMNLTLDCSYKKTVGGEAQLPPLPCCSLCRRSSSLTPLVHKYPAL